LVINKEMTYLCIYCTKTYSTKYNLVKHQKTSKKCLLTQDKVSDISFECVGCDSTFTRKSVYKNHVEICCPYIEIQLSEEYEWKLIEKDEEIEKQSKEIENQSKEIENQSKEIEKLRKELSKRPQINITNHIKADKVVFETNINEKLVEEYLPQLTTTFLDEGAHGLAKFAVEHPYKGNIICRDPSRNLLEYKNADGKIIKDKNGYRISPEFFRGIKSTAEKKITELLENYTTHYTDEKELARQASRLGDIISGVKDGARGEKTTFTSEWVGSLCSLLYSQ
jgi:hypothetical protein